ncbi:sulfatase family protein [Halobaculum sp. EA56]|uniref:sulfatase family protein n=1 Tax=Halobaculum sp. EA56 TaxID=3421648 RepID=UPI003EBE3F1D
MAAQNTATLKKPTTTGSVMNRPNILLLVLDATRADHLSCYGHSRETTPAIDRMANNGVRFTNAFANSNWTGTSHAALFTGLLPSTSGVYAGNQTLPRDVETLPEALQRAGYSTFGVSAGAHLRGSRGYDRGFDRFKETYRISPDKEFATAFLRDPSLRRQTLFSVTRGSDTKTMYKFDSLDRWIGETDAPFFGFINAKTAHHPYNPPRPYKRLFCENLRRSRFQFVEKAFGDEFGERQSLPGMDFERLQRLSYQYPVISGEMDPTDEEWEVIRSWYDGAIRYMDDRIDELLSALDRRGELSNTYVIITADHGEYFGEHGLEKHYYSLYEPVLHVPLVIRTPERQGITVDRPVSLVDLFPTLLDLAGESVDRPNARSLSPFDGNDPEEERPIFAELGETAPTGITRHHPEFDASGCGRPVQVVRTDEYKLIAGADGERELYRWRTDPAEQNDRSASEPTVVSRLEDQIASNLAPLENEALNEEIEDDDLKQHLEDLGYM